MADSCLRPRLAKIVLGIGAFFFVTAIVCLAVGGPLYVQERSKMQSYKKDFCRVRSVTYETIDKCIETRTRTMKYETCYVAVWHVELGQNGTRKEAVRGNGERSYQAMETKSQQYKVWSNSYICAKLLKHTYVGTESLFEHDS